MSRNPGDPAQTNRRLEAVEWGLTPSVSNKTEPAADQLLLKQSADPSQAARRTTTTVLAVHASNLGADCLTAV
jgi:hypothetical protein